MKIGPADTHGKPAESGVVIVHRHYTKWADMRRAMKQLRNTGKYNYFMSYQDTAGPSLFAHIDPRKGAK